MVARAQYAQWVRQNYPGAISRKGVNVFHDNSDLPPEQSGLCIYAFVYTPLYILASKPLATNTLCADFKQ